MESLLGRVEVLQISVKGTVLTDHHTNVNVKTKTPHKYENKNTIQMKKNTIQIPKHIWAALNWK